MTSMTTSPPRKPVRVLLDSNIVAKPVTRTLLMIGGESGGFVTGWTAYIEMEANRHLGSEKMSATQLRIQMETNLWSSGTTASTYARTDPKDQQVLADAVESKARFIVTEDVDDFDEADLVDADVAAVNPDLFLSQRLTSAGYEHILTVMCAGRTRQPNTPQDLHVSLGRQHPLLVAEFAGLFEISAAPSMNADPTTMYRGARCLICGRKLSKPSSLHLGVGPECRKK